MGFVPFYCINILYVATSVLPHLDVMENTLERSSDNHLLCCHWGNGSSDLTVPGQLSNREGEASSSNQWPDCWEALHGRPVPSWWDWTVKH